MYQGQDSYSQPWKQKATKRHGFACASRQGRVEQTHSCGGAGAGCGTAIQGRVGLKNFHPFFLFPKLAWLMGTTSPTAEAHWELEDGSWGFLLFQLAPRWLQIYRSVLPRDGLCFQFSIGTRQLCELITQTCTSSRILIFCLFSGERDK